ncbi:MAG TPA: hypothetical protein DHV62_03220 [Elusimicrobia bacterium]|nr:hypothetical protein [Elusimicrobiota bacterium]
MDGLKILGVEEIADIITPKGVNAAIDAVRKEGIDNGNITLINSPADFKAIQDKLGLNKEEFLKTLDLSAAESINSSRRGVKAINLQTPGQGSINNIVDIIEGAIAGTVGKEHPVGVKKYDGTLQIYSAPLVPVTKEVSEEQEKYETALETVDISG